MKLIIEGLDHQGRGISKQNEKVYFIENALPNEEVEVEIIKEKKNIAEGKVIKYYKKNDSLREEPLCPYYGICGGCDIMHIKNQNKYKQDKERRFKAFARNSFAGRQPVYGNGNG